MHADPNPYDPPSASKPASALWNRSRLIEAGFCLQAFALGVDLFFSVHSEPRNPTEWIESDPRFNAAIAACAFTGLAIVAAASLTNTESPLYLRLGVLAADGLLVALLAWVSDGFGILG